MINYPTGQVPSSGVILPFYFTGTIAFLVLCLLLVWSPQSLLLHYFNPHLLGIVHVAALGWGTMIVFGASYQLLPVISEHNLKSTDLAILSYYLLMGGVILLAWSLWAFRPGWIMITGGSLIVVSALLYLINTVFTGQSGSRISIQKIFMISSACWLVFTTVVGLLLAINLAHPFFSQNHMEILKIHGHLGLAGWFLQLITGVSSRLVPMFLVGRSEKNRLLPFAFVFQNASLLMFISDVYFFGYGHRVLIYLVLMIIGVICWLAFLADNFQNRIKKKIDFQMRHTFVSLVALIAAIGTIPLVHIYQSSTATIVYGTLLFMGWITGIILGKTFKTLPFIIWNDRYKELTGRVQVPLPRDLYLEWLVQWQFWLYLAALIVLVTGISLANIVVIRLGTVLWAALAMVYAFNVGLIIFHKTKIPE